MIKELKEASVVIDEIISLKDDIFLDIVHIIGNKKIILTWMWSSYFITEIWDFFLKNIVINDISFSVSSDEIKNSFPFLDNNYFIITFSQSWNTKEVSNILKKLKNNNISNFSLTNNITWEHRKLSNNNLFFDIGLEKSPVSTKYVIYMVLFLYRFSLIYWNIHNTIFEDEKNKYSDDIYLLKVFSENVFKKYNSILEKLTENYNLWDNFLVIWNWLNYSIAKEISLKIRETTWINSSFDNVWQINHWWINSVNNKMVCILLEDDEEIYKKIIKRWWKIITIWRNWDCDIKYNKINKYIDSVQKIILLQYFVHKLAFNLNINTDKKLW